MAHRGTQTGYSIKLVSAQHFDDYPEHRHNFNGTPLMNFSTNGTSPAIAAKIQAGDYAIVYEMAPRQRFTHAIEYTGTVADGQRIARAQGLPVEGEWDTVVLPIKFLAHVELGVAPDADEIQRLTGVAFTPNAYPMKCISEQDYKAILKVLQDRMTAPPATTF